MTTRPLVVAALAIAALARPPYAAEIFAPGIVSTRDYERDGTFSPDGQSFYFSKRTIWPYFSAICVSHRRGGTWTEPEVATFSGRYSDVTPFITADGARLYFASHRPIHGATPAGYAIWVMDRVGNAWSEPRPLAETINGHGSVVGPVETRNGSLYFIRGDEPKVWVATRHGDGWSPAAQVDSATEPGGAEFAAYVDQDEKFMIVAVAGRPDALTTAEGVYARTDLYAREKTTAGWSPLRHLDAPINSAAEEGAPFVSPDGQYLYFMSERGGFTEHGSAFDYRRLERTLHTNGNGLGDIYRVDFRATGIKR